VVVFGNNYYRFETITDLKLNLAVKETRKLVNNLAKLQASKMTFFWLFWPVFRFGAALFMPDASFALPNHCITTTNPKAQSSL